MQWASENGIVSGIGNNQFAPDSKVTREQLAVIVYRYAQHIGLSTEGLQETDMYFTDLSYISDWATYVTNYCIKM